MAIRSSSSSAAKVLMPLSPEGAGAVGTTVSTTFDFGLSLVITGTPAGEFQSVVPSHTDPRAT